MALVDTGRRDPIPDTPSANRIKEDTRGKRGHEEVPCKTVGLGIESSRALENRALTANTMGTVGLKDDEHEGPS